MPPKRLIRQKYVISTTPAFLEIRAIKEALMLLSNLPEHGTHERHSWHLLLEPPNKNKRKLKKNHQGLGLITT
jgi:hypothetical protein